MESVPGWAQAVRQILGAVQHARPDDLPRLVRGLAPVLGGTALVIYLVDYDQVRLVPLQQDGAADPAPDVESSVPGRVFTTGQPVDVAGPAGGHRLWLPLVNGGDRLGVLAVDSAEAIPDNRWPDVQVLAALLAKVLISRRRYGDAVEFTRRRQPMQVAAEIIWSQLPPLTLSTPQVAISGILEPCYEIGGDSFDYAVNGDTLHVGLFDAVGHGIGASTVTALAVSVYRNARRCGLDLSDTYRSIDKWIHAEYPDRFLTATLAELDTRTGTYRRISAGHPGELLLRDGRLCKELSAPTAMPLGWGQLADPVPTVAEEALQPGDRMLLYTDGVVEARTADGQFFGTDRLVEFVTRGLADQLPAPETLRRLIRAILAHQYQQIQDDATAVLLEWRPELTYGPWA